MCFFHIIFYRSIIEQGDSLKSVLKLKICAFRHFYEAPNGQQ